MSAKVLPREDGSVIFKNGSEEISVTKEFAEKLLIFIDKGVQEIKHLGRFASLTSYGFNVYDGQSRCLSMHKDQIEVLREYLNEAA